MGARAWLRGLTWAKVVERVGLAPLVRMMNVYPPFVGAGVRVRAERSSAGGIAIVSEMTLRRWNKNFVGAHFGGSLYAMCDPFFVLILAERLGPGYFVIDQGATIQFRKLGKGSVRARFEVSDAEVEEIRAGAERARSTSPKLTARVLDESGEVVAEVEKTLYVRKRRGYSWEARYG